MPFSKAPMPDSASGDAPMPSSFDDDLDFWDDRGWAKFWRRIREEPLIPVGLGLTCYALFGATRSIRRGDKTATNAYFRARVYAQGATIVCLCAGSFYYKDEREKRKHYQGLLGEKRAQEKRDAWLRELELRDQEEQEERERKEKRRQALRKAETAKSKSDNAESQANAPLEDAEAIGLITRSPLALRAVVMWKFGRGHESTLDDTSGRR